MTEVISGENAYDQHLPIDRLPKTALQAIYHAVTGKTENMTKELKGSVVINYSDIDILYGMVMDQLGHYDPICPPTVTLVVRHAEEKSVTYSSWERFKVLQTHHLDVTSEVIIKFEFVIRLPNTSTDQRCV